MARKVNKGAELRSEEATEEGGGVGAETRAGGVNRIRVFSG